MFRSECVKVLLVAALVVGAGAAGAQTAPPRDAPPKVVTGTATVRGRVVQLDTGQPVRRVQVVARASESQGQSYSAMTDAVGRFELTALPAGRYLISAAKGGFVTIQHGQRRPLEPGRPLVVADGQTIENVTFSLPRSSALVGRVVDEFGDAVTGATVQAHSYRYVNGQRRLVVAAADPSTDDLGQFRVFGLLPGDYVVSATPPGGSLAAMASLAASGGAGIESIMQAMAPGAGPGHVRTYYPDTMSPGAAQTVSLAVGAESAPLTIQMVEARMSVVSGTVLGLDGKPPATATVMLRPKGSAPDGLPDLSNMAVAQNGVFRVTRVVPGDYTIDAMIIDPFARPPRMTFGSVDIVVSNEDLTNVVVAASPGTTARGRITFEAGQPTGLRPNQIGLNALSPSPSLAPVQSTVNDDWTFELSGVAGTRTLRATAPAPWTLTRILRGSTEVTDTAVDFSEDVDNLTVVFSQRTTEISGAVADAKGAARANYVVLWFADDAARWTPQSRFIQTARPDQDGRYRVRGLPPGRYLAIALDYLEPGEEMDPDRLERFRRDATRVDLGEAESRPLDLRLSDL